MNFNGSGFIPIINYASGLGGVSPPPPGSKIMVTEIASKIMITQSGKIMITE